MHPASTLVWKPCNDDNHQNIRGVWLEEMLLTVCVKLERPRTMIRAAETFAGGI